MVFYVTRHGQTELNSQDKVCGTTDLELTQKGVEQAQVLAEIVSHHKIDRIIASPMIRAKTTSQIIADYNNLSLELDDRLIEQNYGIYEAVSRFDEGFLKAKANFVFRYPKGESMFQTAQRVYNALDDMRKKYDGENVLIVCHGGICRVIRTYFMDMYNDEYFHYSLDNCQLEKYEI